MRIGVISDTHGFLRREVFGIFEGVDHIFHAGDVGSAEILTELEAIAPVTAVWGNTDPMELRARLPRVAAFELEGFNVVVTHGDQVEPLTPEALHAAFPDAELIVHGHTHRKLLATVDLTVTVLNPGAAGRQRLRDGLPCVAILELEPGIPPRGRHVPLTDEE